LEHKDHADEHSCVHIRKLLSGLLSCERARRHLLMLQVFIDDSGRGVDPVFVLAGYVGRVRNWEDFSDRWQKVLKQPPAIEYLKATEAI
jgi:hypothetical protein